MLDPVKMLLEQKMASVVAMKIRGYRGIVGNYIIVWENHDSS